MKKLIVILMIGMIGTFGLVSCGGSQTNEQDQGTTPPADSPLNDEETGQNPDGTMESDTTSMDTTGTGGEL